MPSTSRPPRWRQYLTPDEQALVADLDEAIAMHRKLMAPLFDARRRVTRAAANRVMRAGALKSDAA